MNLGFLTDAFREPAECVIRVDEEEIADFYPFLTEVSVHSSRDEASEATLTFESQRDEHGRFSVQDSGVFAPWKKIVIEACFGSRKEEVLRGYVREIRADYPGEAGSASFTVECQDESIALDRKHVRFPWGKDAKLTDKEIAQQIVGKHGLTLHRDSGTGLSELSLPQDTTDIKFLRARAEANGYELYFRKGEVYFGPMRFKGEAQPTIYVYAGPDTSCLSLSVRSDGHKPTKVAVDLAPEEGDEVKREEIEPDLPLLGSEAAAGDDDGLDEFTWLISREGSIDRDELVARAKRRANELSLRVSAEGELDGTIYGHVLLPGLPVVIDGAGEKLGGTYYVDSVTHKFTVDGYRQSMKLLRNAYGDAQGKGAISKLAGLL